MSDFRIEIPIDVTTNANMGQLQQLETLLNKIYSSFQKDRSAAQGVFDAATSGAGRAASAIGQIDTAADKAAQAFDDVGDAANEAGSEGESAAQQAGQAAEELGESVSEAADAYEDVGDAAQQAGHESGSAFTQASSNVDQFTQRVQKSERTLRQAFKEKMQLILEALDKASPALRNIVNTVKGLTAKAWHIAVKMKDMITAPFRKIKDLITSPIVMTLSMAGITMGAGSFVSTFSEFSAGMSNVKALSGATKEEFARLTQTAENLGATTKFTATEAAEGMQYLAMAGWETEKIIDAMPGLLDLAAAGGTSLGTAADIVSDVMTAMGMSANEASTAADIFAKTATSTNTTIENLGETLKYAAPIAHSFGLELSEVSTITGMMANAGIKGSQAGTAIRSSLLAMASPAKDAQEAMKALGLSFADEQGKMKDMKTIIGDLQEAFAGLSEQDKLAYADSLFGKYASSAWLGVIAQGADEYERLFEAIDNSEGAAKEMANTQLDNLAGDMTLLQSAVDGMKISLMKELNPYLRSAVQWVTSKIPEITEKLSGMLKTGLEKAKELKSFISGVFNSADFQNADGFAGKFFVAWDKIIAEPFQNWWNGGGQQTILNAVGKMGKGLGDLYHGIISGIFAALKGQDIDFEGLNITGLAKAGAEAAKEFVSSFMEAFDLKGLFGEMPGLLKAALIGIGGIKAGGTIFSLAKDISTVKLAFKGVSAMAAPAASSIASVGTSAVTAAAGAGKAVSMFGLLKAGLMAIPVWGWVAAAALAAVAIGVVAYKNAQEAHRQELLNAGNDVRAAASAYEESARRVQDAASTIDEIKEIEIRIKQNKQENQNEIQQTKAELAEVQDRIVWLEARLADTTLKEEDIAAYKAELDEIKSRKAEIEAILAADTLTPEQISAYQTELEGVKGRKAEVEAALASGTLTPEEVTAYQSELEALTGREVELTAALAEGRLTASDVEAYQAELDALNGREVELNAALASGTLTPEQIAEYQAELDALKGKEAELKAIIAADSLTAEQVQTYASQLAVLKGREEEINVALASGTLTPEQAAQYESELEILRSREEKLTLKLEGLGVTSAGILFAASLAESIDGKESEISVIMAKSSLTKDQINSYTSELEKIYTREAEIELLQAGASLSPTEVAEYGAALEGIQSRTAEIEAKIADGGLTEEQIKALSEEYATLKTQEAAITIMLSGQSLTEEQLAAIASEYEKLETKRAEINAELNDAGLGITDLEKISAALAAIGDKQAVLNFEFSAGSLQTADLEAYNQQLETLYGHLVELSGGQITEEDVAAGRATEERQQQVQDTLRTQASTALTELETELVKKRDMIPELVERRGEYEAGYQADLEVQDRLSQARADLMQLEAERANLVAQDALLQARAESKTDSYSWDDYYDWFYDTGMPAMQAIKENYNDNIATVKDENGMPVTFQMHGPTDFLWTDDAFSSYLSMIQDAEQQATKRTEANNGDYLAYNESLKGIYSGEVSLATGRVFEGTDLAGMTLEQVTENYAQLDETGRQLWQDAVMALDAVNQQTDYLAESDKTQAVDVVDIVAKAEVMQQVQEQVQAAADSYSAMDENQRAAFAASEEGQATLSAINEALEAIGGQDISSLDEINNALEQIKNADLSSFSLTDAQVAFVALGGDASGAKTSVDALRTALRNLDGTTATTTVTNNVYNNTYNRTSTTPAKNASGGIYDGAFLSWVAEDGPEAIIPLGSERRNRGIDLWLQAGEILGVAEFAEGGIMAPYGKALDSLPDEAWDEGDTPKPSPMGGNGGGGGNTFSITVEANPTFQIEGGDSEDILDKLRDKQRELAELLGGAMADQLEDIVSNMV